MLYLPIKKLLVPKGPSGTHQSKRMKTLVIILKWKVYTEKYVKFTSESPIAIHSKDNSSILQLRNVVLL